MPNARPVLAHHLILTCYGFWLPNDPRGSGSLQVWATALQEFGPGTKVNTRRSVADRPHDRSLRLAAKQSLKYPPVRFDGHQAKSVASGMSAYVLSHNICCYAFAVMPDHAHLVLKQMPGSIDRIAVGLKAASVHSLLEADLHPYQSSDPSKRPKVWARGERNVYLFDDDSIRRSIRYVEGNPPRAGLKPQRWSFVTPYDPE